MHKKCGIHVVPKSNFSLCPLVRHGIQLTVAPRRDGGGRDWREKGGRDGRSEGEERLTAAGRGAKGRGKRGGREEGSEGGLERVLRIAGSSGAAVLCLSECGVGAGVEHLIAIGTPRCCNREG